MRLTRIAVAAGALLALGAPAFAQQKTVIGTPMPAPMGANLYTFKFKAFNGSGETGTLTLQSRGHGTVFTINVTGEAAGADQIAHIHPGTCADIDQKKITAKLKDVVNGKSVTTVDTPTGRFFGQNSFAVDIHKSADIYVACADIHVSGMTKMATPAPKM